MFAVKTYSVTNNVSLREYTTFHVGGPAKMFARASSESGMIQALRDLTTKGSWPFVLGGGANIVVSDAGLDVPVLYVGDLREIGIVDTTRLVVEAGLPVSDAAEFAADAGLGGLDFLYSMPGSTGGAVWMNARCYGSEVAHILAYVDYLDETGSVRRYVPSCDDFSYKRSPFQFRKQIILRAGFDLSPEDPDAIRKRMEQYQHDRESKGHFLYPSAGSMFKNNRDFGEPSGKIIDRAGLRGFQIGGARVSDRHGNIFVNVGGATGSDVRTLMITVRRHVYEQFGFWLEPEVAFVGRWES